MKGTFDLKGLIEDAPASAVEDAKRLQRVALFAELKWQLPDSRDVKHFESVTVFKWMVWEESHRLRSDYEENELARVQRKQEAESNLKSMKRTKYDEILIVLQMTSEAGLAV